MKRSILALLLGWFMLLKTIEGGAIVGPFERKIDCEDMLEEFVTRLEAGGVKLLVAECVLEQRT